VEEGPRPIRIAFLSDPHTQAIPHATSTAKLRKAVADYRALRPDLWVVNGDVTDHGLPAEYETFFQVMQEEAGAKARLLCTTGNHEFYDKGTPDAEEIRRFCSAFRQEKPYSNLKIGGIHLVMLADEMWNDAPKNPDWAWLTAEQVAWFDKVLAENKELFTVVCLHQPLQNTLLWTHGGNNFAGCGQEKELKAILARNPQVKVWFSGHTHQRIDAEAKDVRIGQTRFLALGSTFYQLFYDESKTGWPYRQDLQASQSRLMEIWPDRIDLKVRDHGAGVWLNELALTWPRT
jgi:Icc protein